MKAEYTDVIFDNGSEILGTHKIVTLPFRRTSARAIILRRKDGAILGTLHHQGGMFALPGGAIDDGESADAAVIRELKEENITLLGSDVHWRERISVDYYDGYKEVTVWFVFIVDEVTVKPCDETIESRWINQEDDVWYPLMREKILLTLMDNAPDYVKVKVMFSTHE